MKQKLLDIWSKRKKKTENNFSVKFFHPREIWFARLGENIGYEQNGKGNYFLRPVIVLKKFNKDIFLAIPLSTRLKTSKYYFPVLSGNKKAVAILSQIRLIDKKRLQNKVGVISENEFLKIKKAISEIIISNNDF